MSAIIATTPVLVALSQPSISSELAKTHRNSILLTTILPRDIMATTMQLREVPPPWTHSEKTLTGLPLELFGEIVVDLLSDTGLYRGVQFRLVSSK